MPRRATEVVRALEGRFDAGYAALPADVPAARTDERRAYVRALDALRDVVLELVRARGLVKVNGVVQWVALQSKCAAVEHRPCSAPSCKGGVQPLTAFGQNVGKRGRKQASCSTCNNRETNAVEAKARRERASANAAALAAAPEVVDTGAVEDRLADAMCAAAAPGDFVKMPEFRRTDVLADAGDGSDLLIKVQLKASESQGKQAAFACCFGYGAGEDSVANAAHRMVLVLGWKPPGDGAAYVLWVFDSARVPSNDMRANTTTRRLCPRTLNMAPNATLATLLDVVRRVAAEIAADGGSARSTHRDAFFDVAQAKQRTEVAGILAFEAAGLGAVAFPVGSQDDVDVHLDGVPTQAKTANETGVATMHHSYKGERQKPYHERDAIEQVLVHTLYKSGDDLWLMHSRIPKKKLVKECIFCRGKERQGGQTSLTLPLWRWSPWLAGKPCPSVNSGRVKGDDWRIDPLYGWRPPVKVETGDVQLRDFLWEAAREVAAPAKAPTPKALDEAHLRLAAAEARRDADAAHAAERAARQEREAGEAAARDAIKAAREVKATAERAEAGPSTVNNTTNMSGTTINNNNYHLHVHVDPLPASRKRLLNSDFHRGQISKFFKRQ